MNLKAHIYLSFVVMMMCGCHGDSDSNAGRNVDSEGGIIDIGDIKYVEELSGDSNIVSQVITRDTDNDGNPEHITEIVRNGEKTLMINYRHLGTNGRYSHMQNIALDGGSLVIGVEDNDGDGRMDGLGVLNTVKGYELSYSVAEGGILVPSGVAELRDDARWSLLGRFIAEFEKMLNADNDDEQERQIEAIMEIMDKMKDLKDGEQ